MARRWSITLIAVGLFLAGVGGFKYWQIRSALAQAEAFGETAETVQAVTVQPRPWPQSLQVTGEIRAPRNLELRNEVEGVVAAVGFAAGASVQHQQLLLQLDSSEESAQLRAAQAEMELAQRVLDRYQTLLNRSATSADQYDQARLQHAIASAQVQALQARIRKKAIVAPFAARAGLHALQVGQYLEANSIITQLTGEDDHLWVEFSLPQESAVQIGAAQIESVHAESAHIKSANIKPAQSRSMQIAVLTRAGAEPVPARLIARDAQVSTQSRQLRLRARLPRIDGLQHGNLVQVQLTQQDAANVLAVPVSALQHDSRGTWVFVLEADTENSTPDNSIPDSDPAFRARKRAVQPGTEQQQWIAISGVQAGEQIATEGAYKLMESALVQIQSDVALAQNETRTPAAE